MRRYEEQSLVSKGVCEYALLLSILFLVYQCPYNKVEESFNTQAVHDILNYEFWNEDGLRKFDHIEFPGVVPRTFLGPLLLGLISWPFVRLARTGSELLSLCGDAGPVQLPYLEQIIVRSVLGTLLWFCFRRFSDAVSDKFGERVCKVLLLLTTIQFHMPFYMSRTLPNTFALCIVLPSYSQWLRGRAVTCLCMIGACAVIFRCDVLVLAAPLYIQMLVCGEVKLLRTIPIGIASLLISLVISLGVDTYFWRPFFENSNTALAAHVAKWQGLVWPEGLVLLFNTVQNRSSEWGTQPWHWYATNALPRALNISYILLFAALFGIQSPSRNDVHVEKRSLLSYCAFSNASTRKRQFQVVYYIFPAIAFVTLYSVLPHKELRFIFPALPLFTLGAAVGFERLFFDDHGDVDIGVGERKNYSDNFNRENSPKRKSRHLKSVQGDSTTVDSGSVPYNSRNSLSRVVNVVFKLSVFICILAGLLAYNVFLLASMNNYPGGNALDWFVRSLGRIPADEIPAKVHVHIGVDACMTGVSRFGQIPSIHGHEIIYSKEEGLLETKDVYNSYHFLITSDPAEDRKWYENFETVHIVQGFTGLQMHDNLKKLFQKITKRQGHSTSKSAAESIAAASTDRTSKWHWLPPYAFPFAVNLKPLQYVLKRKVAHVVDSPTVVEVVQENVGASSEGEL